MYRRVYRQEGGGLSDLGSEAFMRQYVDNYVQDYNRRNQGEVAQRVGARPVPRFNNRYLPTPRQPIPIPQQVLDVPQQVQPIPIPQQVLDVPQQVQQQLNINEPVATPISMQNEQQGLPSLMKIVNEQQNPTPSNATGFNSKEDAMEDLRLKYPRAGLVAMPHQNTDGSWSYQPPKEPMFTHYPGMAM
jgi:hypothetical protein